jgi:tetratricopeptide (TPR) repeat protein|nr:MAG TPA: minor capsid component [Caudoviricetes sp.]
MNELYGQTCSCCHHAHPRNEASVSASFTPELMARLLADIYAKTFNVEEDIYPELYEAARDTFERALQEGYPIENVDDADTLFRQALKDDADVFAAFRTHRMQNDIASQLLDEDGRLKEFRQFREDAESVIGTYNNHWLRTEYDTAVLRARYAADWKRFSRNADILPNLKWMPTTSADPDVFHMEYWRIGLTLPKTHPFWKNHHPHDRWGCKCDLEETDDPVTGIIPEVDYKPSPGLENNPGLEPELFSHTHPYYTKAYPGAEKAVEKVINDSNNPKALRKRLEKWYKENLPAVKVGKMEMKRFEVATPEEPIRTIINRNFYEETASKYKDSPEYAKRLELARQAHLIFPKAKHVRDEVSRDHEDASMFKVYEYETEYGIVEFKCKVNNDGYFLHYMRLLKE